MSLVDTVLGWFGLARVRREIATRQPAGRAPLSDAAGFQLPVHGAPRAGPEPLPELSSEQRAIMDDLLGGGLGSQVALVLGAAGTGKSTLIQALVRATDGQAIVCAFTGVAALRVDGTTIHRLFGFGPHVLPREKADVIPYLPEERRQVLAKARFLVIDEVSMVRCDLFDAIDRSLRLNLGKPDLPFGGKRLVLVGDMLQLTPIVGKEERQTIHAQWPGEHFFHARVWDAVQPRVFQLTVDHRAAGDQPYRESITAIRAESSKIGAVETLQELIGRNRQTDQAVVLTPYNKVADSVNAERLAALPGVARRYIGTVHGEFSDRERPVVPTHVELKVGARVMVAANDHVEPRRYVNGTTGTVRDLQADRVLVRKDDGEDVWIERFRWDRFEPQWDEELGKIVLAIVASYTQIPLLLGWAFTVHKAQGITFDRAHIKPGRGFFCSGHAYVAVTRCRTSAGLSCDRELRPGDFEWDDAVREFLASVEIEGR
ncbi:MAG: AAA family ATPase [Fimbriimonadaceae bacterium]|nr:AAA family ATPase [Fimbriimonadaceae bacterium]QYK58725.1 MAG: AAA family ATPase [Fimbriimonadaceae bacterium]